MERADLGVRDDRWGWAWNTSFREKKYTLPTQIHYIVFMPIRLALGLLKGLKSVY